MFKPVIQAIKDHKDIVLATHVLPDGDAIGSVLGLGIALRGIGKNVVATWSGKMEVPEQYRFLGGQELLAAAEHVPERPPLLIALDCGSRERLGTVEKQFKKAELTINIDHHRNNTEYAEINAVWPDSPATCEIIYELLGEMGIQVGLDIAENLYTGLVTDTGRFQYTNTNQKAFNMAAELVNIGVDPSRVFRHVYENSTYKRLKLAGLALSKTVLDADLGFIYTIITKEDFAATGAGVEDTENLIDFLRAVAGIDVAAVFKETDGGLRISLRSTGSVDVGEIAESKGGGGHRLAAGYNGTDVVDDAVEDLRSKINASKA
jgi:bifunctional oligoribonuclease and PAP phosphatase NrnA